MAIDVAHVASRRRLFAAVLGFYADGFGQAHSVADLSSVMKGRQWFVDPPMTGYVYAHDSVSAVYIGGGISLVTALFSYMSHLSSTPWNHSVTSA